MNSAKQAGLGSLIGVVLADTMESLQFYDSVLTTAGRDGLSCCPSVVQLSLGRLPDGVASTPQKERLF